MRPKLRSRCSSATVSKSSGTLRRPSRSIFNFRKLLPVFFNNFIGGDIKVKVSGTPGTPFSGVYGMTAGGTRSVEGVIPTEYET